MSHDEEIFRLSEPDPERIERCVAEVMAAVSPRLPNAHLEHVGSTAIPGCIGKGDIDILVRVAPADFERSRAILDDLLARSPRNDPTPSYVEYDYADGPNTASVHLVAAGGTHDDFHTFTALLLADRTLRGEYNALKLRFDGRSMDEYREAKGEFIQSRLSRTTALLLVDIQNDYFPGGAMELNGPVKAASRAQRLLAAFRTRNLPVVHIQHISDYPGATFFLPQTRGAEIHESVLPRAGEPVFQKRFPNAFRDTPLLEHLRSHGITRLVIAGMMTHMCIDTTVHAAADLGFSCVLAHDACATRDLSFAEATVAAADVQAAYLAALNGIFAQVRAAADICDELEQ